MQIAHILIASDLSPDAVRPCAPIADLARTLGARITLLHVAVDVPLTGLAPSGEPLLIPIDPNERIAGARAQLEKQLTMFPGLEVAVEVQPGLDPAYQIVEYAEANGVDLIAMSTHGRTGFRHLVLGSVAEGVLRRSTVPVLVFPRSAAEAERADESAA